MSKSTKIRSLEEFEKIYLPENSKNKDDSSEIKDLEDYSDMMIENFENSLRKIIASK